MSEATHSTHTTARAPRDTILIKYAFKIAIQFWARRDTDRVIVLCLLLRR